MFSYIWPKPSIFHIYLKINCSLLKEMHFILAILILSLYTVIYNIISNPNLIGRNSNWINILMVYIMIYSLGVYNYLRFFYCLNLLISKFQPERFEMLKSFTALCCKEHLLSFICCSAAETVFLSLYWVFFALCYSTATEN